MKLIRFHGSLNSVSAHDNSSAKTRVIYIFKELSNNLDLLTTFLLVVFFGYFFKVIFINLDFYSSIAFSFLYLLLVVGFLFIIYTRRNYLSKMRFGSFGVGEKLEENGVYVGNVLYENHLNMPNYFVANDTDLMYDFFNKNKDNSDVDFLIISKEENINKYLKSNQRLLPVNINDTDRIKKIFEIFQNPKFFIEKNKFFFVLIEDIFMLQNLPNEISFLVREGYNKGLRVFYGGIKNGDTNKKGIGDYNAFLLEKDFQKNALISKKML